MLQTSADHLIQSIIQKKLFLNFNFVQWAAEPRQAAWLEGKSDTQNVGERSHYVFGREADLVIDDPSVSRCHAALVHHNDGRIYMIDLASVSKVFNHLKLDMFFVSLILK